MKSIPELEDETMQTHLDQNRANICFKHESTAYHITLFFKMLTDFIRDNYKDAKGLLEYFASNLGRFPDKLENEI